MKNENVTSFASIVSVKRILHHHVTDLDIAPVLAARLRVLCPKLSSRNKLQKLYYGYISFNLHWQNRDERHTERTLR